LTAAWVVARAGGRCQITPGCPRPATAADHIVPVRVLAERSQLDRFNDPDNLQAGCAGQGHASSSAERGP
jgi:hypothetical protein